MPPRHHACLVRPAPSALFTPSTVFRDISRTSHWKLTPKELRSTLAQALPGHKTKARQSARAFWEGARPRAPKHPPTTSVYSRLAGTPALPLARPPASGGILGGRASPRAEASTHAVGLLAAGGDASPPMRAFPRVGGYFGRARVPARRSIHPRRWSTRGWRERQPSHWRVPAAPGGYFGRARVPARRSMRPRVTRQSHSPQTVIARNESPSDAAISPSRHCEERVPE
jgi:hypothetical protein